MMKKKLLGICFIACFMFCFGLVGIACGTDGVGANSDLNPPNPPVIESPGEESQDPSINGPTEDDSVEEEEAALEKAVELLKDFILDNGIIPEASGSVDEYVSVVYDGDFAYLTIMEEYISDIDFIQEVYFSDETAIVEGYRVVMNNQVGKVIIEISSYVKN